MNKQERQQAEINNLRNNIIPQYNKIMEKQRLEILELYEVIKAIKKIINTNKLKDIY